MRAAHDLRSERRLDRVEPLPDHAVADVADSIGVQSPQLDKSAWVNPGTLDIGCVSCGPRRKVPQVGFEMKLQAKRPLADGKRLHVALVCLGKPSRMRGKVDRFAMPMEHGLGTVEVPQWRVPSGWS